MDKKTKNTIKKMIGNNPVAKSRRKQMQSRLKNREFSFLVPNCLGGILLHDLGLRFLSPTVNLMMNQKDFLSFVLHLDDYLSEELCFLPRPDGDCPRAILSPDQQSSITIYFTHYATEDEAKQKWYERSLRINRENLFVLLEERDGIGRADLEKLSELHARGVMAFTCNEYPDLPYCVYLEKYHWDGEVGNILKKCYLDDSREYERYFDFVKWFNEANGGNYDVSAFMK